MSFYKEIKNKTTLSEMDRAGGPTREDKPVYYGIWTDGVPAVKYSSKEQAEETATELRKEFPGKKVEVRVTEGKFRDDDLEEVVPSDSKLDDIRSRFVPEWEMLDHKTLQAKYVAKDHRQAEEFAEYINGLSEEMDHFAEVTQDVAEVTVKTTTSDVNGLTMLDFNLALKIDDYAKKNDIEPVRMSGNFDESLEHLDEDLRKWFKQKWVRFGPDGKIRGACARGDDSEGKPKCLPQSKAHALGKKGRASAAARKRRQDPNPERSGKAINVATKKESVEEDTEVPFDQCPQCGGSIVHESQLNEKQDACYHKVKSRYKVWPSAYASGALVQCRKKGAANWGNKSESVEAPIKNNKANDDYYKFLMGKAKLGRPLSHYEQTFIKTYKLYKSTAPVTEAALMEGPEDRIKANPVYVNGVVQHLMHDSTVPVEIEHRIGLKPDPQKVMGVWLQFLDKLNAEGHDGIPMSTNKKYHEWLTRIYAQKATPFEDLESRAPQALYQHEVMRRRGLLRPEHTDVNRFGSVAQLEQVMDRLYRDQLRKVLEDEKMKEIIKNSKAVHLVSNDQYDIYVPLNRGAGVKYGKGTRWCTASTSSSNYYDRYSRQGYLYIIMPKGGQDEDKFQFHLESDSFMDSADNRAPWEKIRQQFPDLKKDVMAGLDAHPELGLTPEQFNDKIKGADKWYGLRRYFDTITQDENN